MGVTQEELIEYMKSYDFINNSKVSFAKKYNISVKTVCRYLKLNNIEHRKREIIQHFNRDSFGRFTFSNNNNDNKIENKLNSDDFFDNYNSKYGHIFK